MMQEDTKPLSDGLEAALEKIRVMLVSSGEKQTTPKPPDEKQLLAQKRRWLNQVINLKSYHPQLQALEDAVYDFCIEYTKNPTHGKRLVIYGENGTGKSHTAKAIARWAIRHAIDFNWISRHGDTDCESRPPRCLFRRWRFLLNDLKQGFGSGEYSEIFDRLCCTELLVLDDVGTDNDPNKFGVEQFYMLLEARETRWTVITTNISPDFWEERFERRIASRLLRNSIHVPLTEVQDYNSR